MTETLGRWQMMCGLVSDSCLWRTLKKPNKTNPCFCESIPARALSERKAGSSSSRALSPEKEALHFFPHTSRAPKWVTHVGLSKAHEGYQTMKWKQKHKFKNTNASQWWQMGSLSILGALRFNFIKMKTQQLHEAELSLGQYTGVIFKFSLQHNCWSKHSMICERCQQVCNPVFLSRVFNTGFMTEELWTSQIACRSVSVRQQTHPKGNVYSCPLTMQMLGVWLSVQSWKTSCSLQSAICIHSPSVTVVPHPQILLPQIMQDRTGVFTTEENPPRHGPLQFKPALFKGQLYCIFS